MKKKKLKLQKSNERNSKTPKRGRSLANSSGTRNKSKRMCKNLPYFNLTIFLAKIQERTVIFVGEPNSGKSSIISLLKGTLKEEPPKPTSSFEYSYARRNTENRREILNFYELPGGKFSKELTSVPLTLNTIHNAIFVITLDLSNPATVLDSLIFWVENIKEHVINHSINRGFISKI